MTIARAHLVDPSVEVGPISRRGRTLIRPSFAFSPMLRLPPVLRLHDEDQNRDGMFYFLNMKGLSDEGNVSF